MKKVLFVCMQNAGRSQMAEAFFNHLANGNSIGLSAGIRPAARITPFVIEVMDEAGIDVSHRKPKLLTLELMEQVDRIVTMGSGIEKLCPTIFVPSEAWQIEGPMGKTIERVRQIRDEIRAHVEKLVTEPYEEEKLLDLDIAINPLTFRQF
jgi:arsenate reductase